MGKVSPGGMKMIELRNRKGLTQDQLADAIGVTPHTIRNWEKGRSEPRLTIGQVKALCKALDCSLWELPNDFFEVTE